MKAAAIILSGGKSSRMGTNKALIKIEEKTSIERIYAELKTYFDEIILVTNDPGAYEFLKVITVSDQYPGMGPLAGLHAGLKESNYEVNLVVACDMPFVSGELARSLVDKIGDYDAVIPMINGKQQPLFAVFRKKVAGAVEQRIKEGQLKMMQFLHSLHVRTLSEVELQEDSKGHLERAFFNMNDQEDYEKAKKWARDEGL